MTPKATRLPYGMENDSFKISWKVGEGITSFYNKKAEVEMCKPGTERLSLLLSMSVPKSARVFMKSAV